jgi:ribonuclease R
LYIKNIDRPNSTGLLDEIEGVINGHRDGHGYVVRDDGEGDIYLPPNEMRAVLHRDRVKARIVRHDRKGRAEGRVVEIVERPPHPIIGRLLHESGVWLVAPEDKRYGQDVLIPKGATGLAKSGQVVVVELTEPPSLYGQPVGRVKEVLGEIDDPGMEIEIAVRKYGVPHEFSESCIAQARSLPDKVGPKDRKGRVDLTDVPLVTIDGEDARDFDDAVYCEPAKVGRGKGWRLLVAIADVSHYVETGSAIDVDAYDRATSVYFPRRVIPMLPEKLSNGLCSLNPEVDRLCMVCDMLVTATGEMHAYQFYPAVMYSHARMTYTEVAAILATRAGRKRHAAQGPGAALPEPARRLPGAAEVAQHARRGGLRDHGNADHLRRERPHRADRAARAQRRPQADRGGHAGRQRLLGRLHPASQAPGPVPRARRPDAGEEGNPARLPEGHGRRHDDQRRPDAGRVPEDRLATKERPDAQQISTMLLRSMQQAIYSPFNSGHFGLAYEAYTHFTSPIRRYPDLLVHRVIKAILSKERYQLPALPTPGEAHEKLARRLASRAAAPATSRRRPARRRRASAGLGSRRLPLQRQRAPRRRGQPRRRGLAEVQVHARPPRRGVLGRGHAATSFGIFVTLDAMYVEGLVHITELGGEYFKFDEARQELRGERTGIRYAIGTRLRVQVSRVDLDGRKIDFRLVREGEELMARAMKDKGVATGRVEGVPAKSSTKRAAKKVAAARPTGRRRWAR